MDQYVIQKQIGSGSFGKVFIVETKRTGIQYVVKQVDLQKLTKKQRTAAEQEVKVLAQLNHQHIVRYREAYCDDNFLHIVMELCETGDLHTKIQHQRSKIGNPFNETQIMEYFVQICFALDYIHGRKILHRDLKTKNIFLTKGNIVKLGDFGIAKILDNSYDLAQTCIGSPFYISPEICDNRPYDRKSDIWALGCVFYEIATLRYAFTARNMKVLMSKITSGEFSPLPNHVNAQIGVIIKKMLNPDVSKRPNVSHILNMPYIQKFTVRFSCKSTKNKVDIYNCDQNIRRSFPILNNRRCRTVLPVSKSVINLIENNNSNAITNPEAKYKKVVKRIENDTKYKLPKVESTYYDVIVKSMSNPEKNIFNSQRKKWSINTLEKKQLVDILSEAELSSTKTQNLTVDDLLTMSDCEKQGLSSQILQPQPLINDATIIVKPSINFECLERKRIRLEKKLGLNTFLQIYKTLEQICPKNSSWTEVKHLVTGTNEWKKLETTSPGRSLFLLDVLELLYEESCLI